MIGRRRFQSFMARFPLTRWFARGEGDRLFRLVAGFVHSQVLLAHVELDLFALCRDAPERPEALARRLGLPADRLAALLQAGAALGLMERVGAGFQTGRVGAAVPGVPGLAAMIRHNRILYRDLADPVALLRAEGGGELARFWPYVFGAGAAADPVAAAAYSELMAETQALVAEDALALADLRGVRHLMDVGGGTGAFLAAAARAHPGLALTLFDLPAVLAGAEARLAREGLAGRVRLVPGSFRDDPLPAGADAISLVRVLFDHTDATVAELLARVFAALPPSGRVIVAEPMSGGARPEPAGDAYFAFYCLAMGTGRVRSAARIGAMLAEAGFTDIRAPRPRRSYVTSVVMARKPG
jgi:demethylspheroidene O-methyltransferase